MPCYCASALVRERARDWKTGEESSIQIYFDESIDIHHVFPQQWCRENNIEAERGDSIVNKTPLTARTNRSIGGQAPSEYLERIEDKVPRDGLNEYLRTHLIDPARLRANDFDGFFDARQSALLGVIEEAMGKRVAADTVEEGMEPPADYETVRQDSMTSEDIAR